MRHTVKEVLALILSATLVAAGVGATWPRSGEAAETVFVKYRAQWILHLSPVSG